METVLETWNEDGVIYENPAEDRSLRNLARFYFACIWCVVFTGSIRKWVFQHQPAFYLMQDVPITLSYLYAFKKGIFDKGLTLVGLAFLSVVLMILGLVQVIVLGLDPFVMLVGFHHYLYYLPILVIFPYCLTEKYRRKLIALNLLFAIPFVLLTIAQAKSPTNAFINQTSEGDAFGLPGVDVARISGPFNFVGFFGLWLGIAFSLCLGEWLLRKDRRVFKSRWMLILSTFSLTICCLVSGSRQTILTCAASLFGALVAASILRTNRAIVTVGGILLLLPIGAACTYYISPTEFETVSLRLTGDTYTANSKDRILSAFYAFLTEPKFSLVGVGIGYGVDAAHFGNANAYQFTYELSEADTPRNVMELGTPVGLFYVFVRFAWAIGIILLSVRIVRAAASPHVLPLAFVLGVQVISADLTRNATMYSTQVMLGYAFILGVQAYPDQWCFDRLQINSWNQEK